MIRSHRNVWLSCGQASGMGTDKIKKSEDYKVLIKNNPQTEEDFEDESLPFEVRYEHFRIYPVSG